MSKLYVTVFDNINGELRRRNISQEKLCRTLRIERRTYMAWQKRNEMPLSFFLKCISYFGCSADYLLRDVVRTEKNAELKEVQQKCENVKLYPEKTNFSDCLKAVLKATHDTCGE